MKPKFSSQEIEAETLRIIAEDIETEAASIVGLRSLSSEEFPVKLVAERIRNAQTRWIDGSRYSDCGKLAFNPKVRIKEKKVEHKKDKSYRKDTFFWFHHTARDQATADFKPLVPVGQRLIGFFSTFGDNDEPLFLLVFGEGSQTSQLRCIVIDKSRELGYQSKLLLFLSLQAVNEETSLANTWRLRGWSA